MVSFYIGQRIRYAGAAKCTAKYQCQKRQPNKAKTKPLKAQTPFTMSLFTHLKPRMNLVGVWPQ